MQKRYLQIHLKISSFIFLGTFSTFKQESSVIFLIMIIQTIMAKTYCKIYK